MTTMDHIAHTDDLDNPFIHLYLNQLDSSRAENISANGKPEQSVSSICQDMYSPWFLSTFKAT